MVSVRKKTFKNKKDRLSNKTTLMKQTKMDTLSIPALQTYFVFSLITFVLSTIKTTQFFFSEWIVISSISDVVLQALHTLRAETGRFSVLAFSASF